MTAPARPELTERQAELLRLTADGLTLEEIARRWGIEPVTVRGYSHRLCRRLGARHLAHAVHLAHQAGLLRRERHGDHPGYEAHIRRGDRGDAICDACRAGEKAYRADRRRAQQARESATRRLSRPNSSPADSGASGLENASEAHSPANRPTHQTKAA